MEGITMAPPPGLLARAAPYPDYANPQLLEKIPLNARLVLDVGCGQGALGAAYLRRNPRARYLGIDSDPAVVRIARQRLTEMACADVEAEPLPFADQKIDCIIYGDILEHLSDPWTLLRRHAASLAPDGTVLVCTPNVEHWRLTQLLLSGGFDYQDTGLLDRTHLRWFTSRTMGKALAEAGLQLADLAPRPVATQGAQAFVKAMAPGLRAAGIDPQEYFNRAWPLQYIWRARKASPDRIFINATALPPQGGVSEVRIVEPHRALKTDSAVLGRITREADLPHLNAETPHIAILHRPLLLGADGIARIRNLLAKNYVIVSEFDDHPDFMAGRGVNLDQLLTFRAVHAIQTSTAALAEVLRRQNPEVAVFPNAIFELPPPRNFAQPETLTLFFGALNREADWAPLMPALNAVARHAGPRLKFSVVHDRAFFDALDTRDKKIHPRMRLRNLHAAAGRGRNRLHAAGRHALQPRQIRPEIHRSRGLPARQPGQPDRLRRRDRTRQDRLSVRIAGRPANPAAAVAGAAANRPPGRRGSAKLRHRAAHAGLSAGRADQLVSQTLGKPRRAEPGIAAARASPFRGLKNHAPET